MVTGVTRSVLTVSTASNRAAERTEDRCELEGLRLLREQFRRAAEDLFDHECALHSARQSGIEIWVAAAAERLHESYQCYRTAAAALAPADNTSRY